jgi:uncharacterized protein (TIGR02594 family)
MSFPWIIEARRHIGLREIPGKGTHKQILKWWSLIRAPFTDDETPWCAGFVGGCFESVGIRSTRSAAARSYLRWGSPIDKPSFGCVVVFWRGSPQGWSGHVGFVMARDRSGENIYVLGGNQRDGVNQKWFPTERVLGYRWPTAVPEPLKPFLRIADMGRAGLSLNEA